MKRFPALTLILAIVGLGSFMTPGSSMISEARAQAPVEARVDLHIEGMHCASCSLTIRTVLGRLDGVRGVTVSVGDERAHVVYDPRRVTPARIAQTVTDAGYPASVERESAR